MDLKIDRQKPTPDEIEALKADDFDNLVNWTGERSFNEVIRGLPRPFVNGKTERIPKVNVQQGIGRALTAATVLRFAYGMKLSTTVLHHEGLIKQRQAMTFKWYEWKRKRDNQEHIRYLERVNEILREIMQFGQEFNVKRYLHYENVFNAAHRGARRAATKPSV